MRGLLSSALLLGVTTACDGGSLQTQEEPEEENEPFYGSRGLQGIEGEVEGEAVELPSFGIFNRPFDDITGYDHFPFLEDGFVMLAVSGGLPGGGTSPLDFSLLRMPEGNPLAHHWLCGGEGSEMVEYDDGIVTEGVMRNLSDMGSCADPPGGDLWLNAFETAYTNKDDLWTASPELFVEGVRGSTMGGLFEAQTNNGRVMVWLDRAPYERTENPDEAVEEVLEGAILVHDPAGTLLLACAGAGSSVTTWADPDGLAYEITIDLLNVSIVGQCPGTPVSGSLIVRSYYER